MVRHVAISGEVGSGKSAVAAALASAIDAAQVVSTGAIHRRIAAALGQSALQTNLTAEQDTSIDRRIDGELVRLGSSGDLIVFDSRLAWHFVPHALKVHLLVHPDVAAARMLGRGATEVEGYDDIGEARAAAQERHASEQRRFLATYGVDIDCLRNYDLVVDTSDNSIDQVADAVASAWRAGPADRPPCLLLGAARLAAGARRGPHDDAGEVVVTWDRPEVTVVDGVGQVVAAAARGEAWVPARLEPESG